MVGLDAAREILIWPSAKRLNLRKRSWVWRWNFLKLLVPVLSRIISVLRADVHFIKNNFIEIMKKANDWNLCENA